MSSKAKSAKWIGTTDSLGADSLVEVAVVAKFKMKRKGRVLRLNLVNELAGIETDPRAKFKTRENEEKWSSARRRPQQEPQQSRAGTQHQLQISQTTSNRRTGSLNKRTAPPAGDY